MKTARLLPLILLLAVAAYAWPLKGTWKGELNGNPITITVARTENGQADCTFATATSPPVRIQPKFANNFSVLTFQAPNQQGSVRLVSTGAEQVSFELRMTGQGQAELRSLDQPNAPVVRMTHADTPAR